MTRRRRPDRSFRQRKTPGHRRGRSFRRRKIRRHFHDRSFRRRRPQTPATAYPPTAVSSRPASGGPTPLRHPQLRRLSPGKRRRRRPASLRRRRPLCSLPHPSTAANPRRKSGGQELQRMARRHGYRYCSWRARRAQGNYGTTSQRGKGAALWPSRRRAGARRSRPATASLGATSSISPTETLITTRRAIRHLQCGSHCTSLSIDTPSSPRPARASSLFHPQGPPLHPESRLLHRHPWPHRCLLSHRLRGLAGSRRCSRRPLPYPGMSAPGPAHLARPASYWCAPLVSSLTIALPKSEPVRWTCEPACLMFRENKVRLAKFLFQQISDPTACLALGAARLACRASFCCSFASCSTVASHATSTSDGVGTVTDRRVSLDCCCTPLRWASTPQRTGAVNL
jgi:hypothetical protein